MQSGRTAHVASRVPAHRPGPTPLGVVVRLRRLRARRGRHRLRAPEALRGLRVAVRRPGPAHQRLRLRSARRRAGQELRTAARRSRGGRAGGQDGGRGHLASRSGRADELPGDPGHAADLRHRHRRRPRTRGAAGHRVRRDVRRPAPACRRRAARDAAQPPRQGHHGAVTARRAPQRARGVRGRARRRTVASAVPARHLPGAGREPGPRRLEPVPGHAGRGADGRVCAPAEAVPGRGDHPRSVPRRRRGAGAGPGRPARLVRGGAPDPRGGADPGPDPPLQGTTRRATRGRRSISWAPTCWAAPAPVRCW